MAYFRRIRLIFFGFLTESSTITYITSLCFRIFSGITLRSDNELFLCISLDDFPNPPLSPILPALVFDLVSVFYY